MSKKRLDYIDFTKGIAIILVIFAHSLAFADIPRAIIFSFHMPLFFICSGITGKPIKNSTGVAIKIVSLIKKTIAPVLLVYLIYAFSELFGNFTQNFSWSFAKRKIVGLLFSLGQDEKILGSKVESIGMLWFLVTFFFAQLIYLLVKLINNKNVQTLVILIIAIIGFIVGKKIILPFDLDIAMVMTLFLLGGWFYRKYIDNHFNNGIVTVISLLVWGLTFFAIYYLKNHYLIVSERSYPIFPFSLLTAFAGTLVIIGIGKYICSFKIIKPINIIGKYSIRLFIIHALDLYWSKIFNITNSKYVNGIVRVAVDLLVLIFVSIIINRVKVYRDEKSVQKIK